MKQKLKIIFAILFLCGYPSLMLGDDQVNPKSDGASSLIFVFDITGSMNTELQQVKDGALQILQQLSQRTDKIIHDYILVPFNDPDVGPATKTTNVTEFDAMLRKLTVDGGGDCPEMSLTGIKKGLELGMPNSFLFVFTDDGPKDSQLLPEILAINAGKHTQVVFILTDVGINCKTGLRLEEYEEIASATNGLIFPAGKFDIPKILDFIKFSLKNRTIDLLAVDNNKNKTSDKFDIPVDETIKELIFKFTANNDVRLIVTNPLGQVFNDSSFCNNVLEIRKSQMCSVQNPVLGIWKLLVEAVSSFSLRVSATSNITFDFGFEIFPDNQTSVTNRTLCEPVEGTENIFILKLNDTSRVSSLTFGEIIAMDGHILSNFSLKSIKEAADLFYGSFIPFNSSYHLRINGETTSGFKFQRVTSIAFSSYSSKTEGSKNCTARKIDYVPKASLQTSSSAFLPMPWFTGLYTVLMHTWIMLSVPSPVIC